MATTKKPSEGHKPDKLIRDALIACQRQNPNQLKRIAKRWLDMAESGDLQAIISLTNRLDGLPKQAIDLTSNGESVNPSLSRLAQLMLHVNELNPVNPNVLLIENQP